MEVDDVKAGGYVRDCSKGLENVPMPVKTESTNQPPPKFKYVTSYVLGEGVEDACTIDSMACCDCSDGCKDPNVCKCLRLEAQPDGSCSATSFGRNYNDDGLLIKGEARAIYECHAGCACNPQQCKNRVVSKGVTANLEVRTRGN